MCISMLALGNQVFAVGYLSETKQLLEKSRDRFDPIRVDEDGLIRQSGKVIGSYALRVKKNIFFQKRQVYSVYDLGGKEVSEVVIYSLNKSKLISFADNRVKIFKRKHGEETSFLQALKYLVLNGYL